MPSDNAPFSLDHIARSERTILFLQSRARNLGEELEVLKINKYTNK